MTDQTRTQLEALMAHIEEMWGHLNILFDDLNTTNGWDKKHGPDWTFAHLPFHLAYCNRDILIRGIEAGADLPEEEQELIASVEAMNAWNAREFAERPADQTPAQSVAQWLDSCEKIRRMTAQMSDADLEKPFWMPLFSGWSTAREGFEFTRAHDWSEFMQLRIHMGREEPVPSAGVTRAYLGRMLGALPMFLNQAAASNRQFTAVMAFTDPGVGAFTLRVADGEATLKSGETPGADLVMTQSAATYLQTLVGMHDPGEAIQSGLIQVNNFESLATFGQLFPMP